MGVTQAQLGSARRLRLVDAGATGAGRRRGFAHLRGVVCIIASMDSPKQLAALKPRNVDGQSRSDWSTL